MPRWIVKVNRYKEQVRITIPKALAVESGLFEARLAEIRATEAGRLEVNAFEGDSGRDSDGERTTYGADRPASKSEPVRYPRNGD